MQRRSDTGRFMIPQIEKYEHPLAANLPGQVVIKMVWRTTLSGRQPRCGSMVCGELLQLTCAWWRHRMSNHR
jgi:hypothetical protein